MLDTNMISLPWPELSMPSTPQILAGAVLVVVSLPYSDRSKSQKLTTVGLLDCYGNLQCNLQSSAQNSRIISRRRVLAPLVQILVLGVHAPRSAEAA